MKYSEIENELFYSEEDYFQEYQFIKTPKILITSEFYKNLSLGAKMLYSILSDRQSLSLKNKDKFTDENGKIFLIFSLENLEKILNLSKKTVIKYKKELIKYNLLFEHRTGLNLPNRLYILKPNYSEALKYLGSVKITLQEVENLHFKNSKNYTSRSEKNTLQEVENLHPNNTDYNKTDFSNNNSINQSDEIDLIEYQKYKKIIQENLYYEEIKNNSPKSEVEYLNQIIEIMLDVILSKEDKIKVSGRYISKEIVKSRFLLLRYEHVEYVLESIRKNSKKATNIRNYLITCLYNSYSTILVNIDNDIANMSY